VLVVLLGLDGTSDERLQPIGADDDARAFRDRGSAFAMTANSYDATVLEQQLVDAEAFADLDASSRRGVDQQLVEHGPPRAVRDRRLRSARTSLEYERPEVEGIRIDCGTPTRDQLVEEIPPAQRVDAQRVDHVGRHRVTRKRRPIHQQHPEATSGEEHRRRRPRASRAHHNHVVFVRGHGPPFTGHHLYGTIQHRG